MSTAIAAVKRGYAYVVQNERGHFFSEGNYDILGAPITDGYDAIDWLTRQSWSNGKVGTTGCSSTAEWQPAVASLGHPGFAAMNVQGFGAGVGRVGPYYEQGNWYRGGAVQMLFITWLYGEQNQVRPQFPMETSREDLVAASRLFDLAPQMPPVDWGKVLWHLPMQDIMKEAEGPRGIFADKMAVPTGGAMVRRTPNDPAWNKGGLWHDNMPLNVPGLWFMSWYDVSVGPNLAMFNHVRKTAKPEVASQQWAIIAPVAHCAYTRATADTIVGERSMGDARLDYNEIVYGFFDKFLKGDGKTRLDDDAEGHLLHDGQQQVADGRDVAAGRRRAADVLPVQRREGELALRRRRAGGRNHAADRPRRVRLRSAQPGRVLRRQRLLHRQRHPGGIVRSAPHGGAPRRPGLHHRALQGRHRGERADHADALRVVGCEGHGFHRQGAGRLSRTGARSTWTSRFSACATATATTSRRCGWRRTRSTR